MIACRVSQIGKIALVQFGIAVDVRPGNCGLIFMRSGFAADTGLAFTNAVGVIDSDYRGELMGKINGYVPASYVGARIAQLVVVKCDMALPRLMDKLPETARGTGGFGSTGQ
jgi:dUTP pyrophosphatase